MGAEYASGNQSAGLRGADRRLASTEALIPRRFAARRVTRNLPIEMDISREEIQIAAEEVGRALRARFIALFGSVAREDERPPQDIDLAILSREKLDTVAITNRFVQLLGTQNVDIADLSRADALLLILVAREGVPLYQAQPAEFTQFCSLAARRFADTRKFRDAEREAIREFVGAGAGRRMTEIDAGLVRRKVGLIVQNLDALAEIEGIPLERYIADRFRLKGTERLLQETIEAAVDVNLHLLRANGLPVPPDYHASFIEMGKQGLIPPDLAERLAPATGLRNRLVHEYDQIDNDIVLAAVSKARTQFREYVAAIETRLEEQGF